VVDAKYIIQHLVGMVVDKGVAAQRAKYTHRASRLVHYYEVCPRSRWNPTSPDHPPVSGNHR
jgi:hypothetical protein